MGPRRRAFARSRAVLLGMTGVLGMLAHAASGQDTAARGGSGVERGRAVYEYWCVPCHAAGPGHPGTQSLRIKYGGDPPAVLLERDDLTPAAVKTFVRQGVLSMAPFRKTEITDDELDDLAAYVAE